jgi:serine protease Do
MDAMALLRARRERPRGRDGTSRQFGAARKFGCNRSKADISARRLVLLATGASFSAAARLLGPGGSGQSMLPAVSTANAKESAPQAGRGWIGVQIQPVTTNIAESLGMKEDKGALVAEPLTGGPAAKAGVLSGDVITALNGQPVNDILDLAKQIGDMAPGGAVKLTIWRKGEEKTISLTLGEMPKQHEARAAEPTADADRIDAPRLGLMLASAEHVAGAGSEGVIVIDLDRNGLAFEHGFKIGDIILDVGGKKVVTPVDVRNAVRDAHKDGKRVVLMRLKSNETTKFVAVPIARA